MQAARALGAANSRIMLRHMLPNALAPVIVVATIALGIFIAPRRRCPSSASACSRRSSPGASPSPTLPAYMPAGAAHAAVPGGFLSVTVLAFIMLGDAVRDALDPKLR